MAKHRDSFFSDRMSDHEALMWNIEKDPWLNPNGSALTILDQPVDMDRFRRQLRYGVAKVPRLYERVVPGLGRFSPPAWMPDAEFNFDHHVLEVELPSPGTERQLLDLVTQLSEEPLDRSRPLWRFVVIGGLEDGRGAIWSIFHHVVSDGIGQMRMAELYQQPTRDGEDHAEVDLEEVVAEAVSASKSKERGEAPSAASNASATVQHVTRRQLGVARRILGEVMIWPAEPDRPLRLADNVIASARHTIDQLAGSSNELPGGSSLWKNRSRQRHLDWVRLPLDGLKTAAKARGATINDAFMAGLADAAASYHAKRNVPVDAFNTSFVLSTRSDNNIGGNSFTPVVVQFSGEVMTLPERIADVHSAIGSAREKASHGGGMNAVAGVANLLPTSVVTKAARDRAGTIDFATSNLRGAPFALFCAGARVDAIVCMGPVAGTPVNVTAMSYNGHFDLGLMVDPVAIEDPEDYRSCVVASFDALLAEGSASADATVRPTKTPKKKAQK